MPESTARFVSSRAVPRWPPYASVSDARASPKFSNSGLPANHCCCSPSQQCPPRGRQERRELYAIAGRPTKADFVKVYGPKGPAMTWVQRAKAGVDAKHFQAALAEK